ncbi:sodium-dependent organic anion transporter-like isoform X1 [Tachypleus tridentatus]|uniref:sodium-dependent organic anion transporter-like isoform X1 n=1 Tax=Tachypleus tridentatus TaxID=6853 RepID=UPI003FD28FE5
MDLNNSISYNINIVENVTKTYSQLENHTDKETLLIKKIHDGIIVFILVIIMLAMGCDITLSQIWSKLRRPVGVAISLSCQFLLLPLTAFTLMNIFHFHALFSIGMLIASSCPGGTVSNVFTYFCDGDVALSVTMTTVSTVVAIGMMPFTLWIYGHSLDTKGIIIPYKNMALTLVVITIPVCVGILIHWKLPRVARIVTKVGSFCGFAFIVILVGMQYFIFPKMLGNVLWQQCVASLILPMQGFLLGYCGAAVFRQSAPVKRTIAIEVGIQNTGAALTVSALSFPFEVQDQVLLCPLLFGLVQFFACCLASLTYRIYKKWFKVQMVEEDKNLEYLGQVKLEQSQDE